MVKYRQIYQEIKRRIKDQEYPVGEKLPEGHRLAQEFACSELTIKKALDILVSDGLVVRKRGSGSYVKMREPMNDFASDSTHLMGSYAHYAKDGQEVTAKVLQFNAIQAGDELAAKMQCDPNELVYQIERVRLLDGVPQHIEYTFLSTRLIPNLNLEHLHESIYKYITQDLKHNIHSANLRIFTQDPNEIEAKELNREPRDKLICIEQVAFLDNGQLFEYSIAKHTCESFEFKTTFVKSNA